MPVARPKSIGQLHKPRLLATQGKGGEGVEQGAGWGVHSERLFLIGFTNAGSDFAKQSFIEIDTLRPHILRNLQK